VIANAQTLLAAWRRAALDGILPLRDHLDGMTLDVPSDLLCPLYVDWRHLSVAMNVWTGSRNYGDRDKGLAPLSLCESR
jgi:hypothetical protein